ncbi:MAG: pyruvate dehydrogenase (acetyl-transferring), homodimeric type [Acidimicrobiaceae bacterium]|nr:pyruvate dehydrogenase (acetyl-transferring), homodimeric type [Acidimicrobiaceae bacterium]
MIFDGFSHALPDIDPEETSEWLDSFNALVETKGKSRASYILMRLLDGARSNQVGFPATVSTPYINSIPPEKEPWFPGDEAAERRIRAYIRWNAAVMVTRANMASDGIGGHLSTYASSASLYEVGFNHFFKGRDSGNHGDLIYFQGHASPGIYARAFLEGFFSESQLDNFRKEIDGGGLSSYPHPRLMPNFWEFPTVSMGIGPMNAIYQARFNKYLMHRRLVDTEPSKVWAFVGDGEFDEPETSGALGVAGREHLDNLIFVVNCNLQRLDGPVRGNGKIIQELEALFRGAGWNVLKVIWGSKWDELLMRDVDGVLLNKMNSTPDGEFQKYATESGGYIRENFFGPDPRLRKLVEHLSDQELQELPRGGHDYKKLYAAYSAAVQNVGSPTAILAKTIKGWTLGPDIEARNSTHQIKKMTKGQLKLLRDTLQLRDVIPEHLLDENNPPYIRLDPGSYLEDYLLTRRKALGGFVPRRPSRTVSLKLPTEEVYSEFYQGSQKLEVSTTMAFAKLLRNLAKDPSIGERIVPIVPDEARTFGLEAMFRESKIYAPEGQLYTPVDAGLLLSYSEAKDGQIMEMGITEAGAVSTFIAAGTSYASFAMPMIPVYLFYSMFGFQRTGDQIWAANDARARGFLIGATAGRTTLNGEGLQHEDGHSLVLASTVPSIECYDPAFAYEMAIIVEHGLEVMYGENSKDRIFYITAYNENYVMPGIPEGVELASFKAEVIKGIYRFEAPAPVSQIDTISSSTPQGAERQATVLFSGSAHQAARAARVFLAKNWGISVDTWSVTSYKSLREEALEAERYSRLHPGETEKVPYVTSALSNSKGPIIAVSDFMKMVPDQIARFVPGRFVPLGADSFGRSDTRERLRRFFEIDEASIVITVLHALYLDNKASASEVKDAIAYYQFETDRIDPTIA